MGNAWQALWQNKTLDGEPPTLATLIAMVGWKTEEGDLPEATWREFVAGVCRQLHIAPGDAVLEVGCGPGGMLLPLYEQGCRVAGIDYSESLIAICRQVMPEGVFHAGEAKRLPFADGAFDAIFSNSVCHYFPDHAYTEAVLAEIARCLAPGGRGAILDANDAARREAFMEQRYARFGGKEAYERQNGELPQLFYARDWFVATGARYGLAGRTEDQHIPGYRNSRYRFNYFFSKAA
jgi:SAM-dependent methyltransferase